MAGRKSSPATRLPDGADLRIAVGPLHKPHTAQSQRKSGKSALTTLAPPAANVRCGVVIWSDAVLMKFRTEQCKTVPMALRYFRPLRCHGTYPSSLFASWFTWLAWTTEISSGQNTSGGHRSECGARCLTASPARLRVSQGRYRPLADRAFGHAASPRRRTRHPGLPASRARRSPAAPTDCAPVCFDQRPKPSLHFIRLPRPVAAFACSCRANLPSNTHT